MTLLALLRLKWWRWRHPNISPSSRLVNVRFVAKKDGTP